MVKCIEGAVVGLVGGRGKGKSSVLTIAALVLGIVVLGLLVLVFFVVFMRYANLYLRSILTRAGVGLFDMLAMSLRRVTPAAIVNARVMLVQALVNGLDNDRIHHGFLFTGTRGVGKTTISAMLTRILMARDRARVRCAWVSSRRSRPTCCRWRCRCWRPPARTRAHPR